MATHYDEATDVQRETFVSPLTDASREMRKHLEHLRVLTDRMIGPEPTSGTAGAINKLNPVPSGVFDDVRRYGRDLNEMLSEADQLLGRIERALP